MYTDLARADIVTKDATTGRLACHQTDHRREDEINADIDLSVLFALTRVINGRRAVAKDADPASVDAIYVSLDKPPTRLVQAVHAAGGRVRLGVDDALVAYDGPAAATADLADHAFAAVAAIVRDRLGAEAIDEKLLRDFEASIAAEGLDVEDEELAIIYWTRIVELAAVGGEVMRATAGGRWVDAAEPIGVLPFLFRTGHGDLYTVGNKAQRFLDEGDEQSLTQLLRIAEDTKGANIDAGPLLVSFKPGGWPGEKECVCRPLMPKTPPELVLPLIVYGRDLPNTFAHLHRQKDAALAADIDALHAEAVANLANITDVKVQEVDLRDGFKPLAVSDSYFAAEKILDAAFMRSLGKRLGGGLMAVGIPKKGLMFVASALCAPETMDRFANLCAGYHRDGGDRALTPVPILVGENGDIQGVVIPRTAPPEPKKKGFFARLFN